MGFVGKSEEVDRPAPPRLGDVAGGGAPAIVVVAAFLAFDGAKVGGRLAFAAQFGDVEDAEQARVVPLAVVGIEEQEQPAGARPDPAPQILGEVGAGDLGDEMERDFTFVEPFGRDRARPFDVCRHHRQAAEPAARGLVEARRDLADEDERDVFLDLARSPGAEASAPSTRRRVRWGPTSSWS